MVTKQTTIPEWVLVAEKWELHLGGRASSEES
jgi:hypothetical protein